MFNTLKQYWDQLAGAVTPPLQAVWGAFNDYVYLQIAFIVVCSYFLARVLATYVPNIIRKISKKAGKVLSVEVTELLRFPIFNLLFLSGLIAAVNVPELAEPVRFALISTLISLMIAVVGISIYRLIKILLSFTAIRGEGKSIVQNKTLPLFNNIALVFILITAAHQIFAVWDVDMTALLASAGIAGIAIGMAAQTTIADIIAGVLILTDNPFNVDDVIQLENDKDNLYRGKVQRIGIRSTRILNEYNAEIIVPNSKIGNARIINESSSAVKGNLVILNVAVAVGVSSDRLREILLDVMDNYPGADSREKEVELLSFDWRRAKFKLSFWAEHSDWDGHLSSGLREQIYKRLLMENITFSLPENEEIAITQMAGSSSEIAITQIADSRQEISVKEMPESKTNISIKEVPNLFGLNPAKHEGPGQTNIRRNSHRFATDAENEGH